MHPDTYHGNHNHRTNWRRVRATAHSWAGYGVSLGLFFLPLADEMLRHRQDLPGWMAGSMCGLAIVAGALHHYSGQKFPRKL